MSVSVVIPVFNGEGVIGKALESICSQSYQGWECVIVNDVSTDGTSSIVETFCRRDSRIKLIMSDGKGVTDARIKGASVANGEYLFFMDADDTIPRDTLEKLTKTLQTSNADIVIGDINHIDADNNHIAEYGFDKIQSGSELFDWIINNRVGYIWGKLIRRDLFLRVPYQPIGVKFCEDLIQMLQLAAMADSVRHCGNVTYDYFQTQESVCNKILTKDEFAHRFYVICSCLSRLASTSIFNSTQQKRLKALFLYYARLFLLVNGRWENDNDILKSDYAAYIKEKDVIHDTIQQQSYRHLVTRFLRLWPWPLSVLYVTVLRHKHHRIK